MTISTHTDDEVVEILAAQYLADRITVPDNILWAYFDLDAWNADWDQKLEKFGQMIVLQAEAIRVARSRLARLGAAR